MSIYLSALRGDGWLRRRHVDWAVTLSIAHRFGWKPAGTLRPPPALWPPEKPWPGEYGATCQAIVTEADALAIADALEQALPHLVEDAKGEVREVVEFCRRSGGFIEG